MVHQIDHGLEFPAHLEEGQFFGRHFNGFAALGIASHIAGVFLDFEGAQAPEFRPALADQALGDGVEEDIDHLFGLLGG